VIDFVASEIEKHGFAGRFDRIAFFGVSQGAIMALDAVASGRWPVRAAAATNLRLRQQASRTSTGGASASSARRCELPRS
jgi:phospholipase/carboxylesterase